MNFLDTIENADGGAVVQNMSKSLGLGEAQTQSALRQLLPAVSQAIKNNGSSSTGLGTLLGALGQGKPSTVSRAAAMTRRCSNH